MHSSHDDKIKFGEEKTGKPVALQAVGRFTMTCVTGVHVYLFNAFHASPPDCFR